SVARANSARTAALRPRAVPAIVNTERLCAASEDQSSRRTSWTADTASVIDVTIADRRPSLTLGTHSMTAMALLVSQSFERSRRATVVGSTRTLVDQCTKLPDNRATAACVTLCSGRMSEPLRTDPADLRHRQGSGGADGPLSEADRAARIEELLLA